MHIIRRVAATALACVIGFSLTGAPAASAIGAPERTLPFSGCYIYGKLLAGKVQVVTSSLGRATDKIPTFKVQVVNSFPDLKVQVVKSFPNSCGKWQFVNSFPDFKIRYVNSFPDFKIKQVTSFPGR